MHRRIFLLLLIVGIIPAAAAADRAADAPLVHLTRHALSSPLPWLSRLDAQPAARLGEGVGVVFSPDLAPKGNREFYEALGFHYFESADWREILDDASSVDGLRVLIMETHGSNGHGLKVQKGGRRNDPRSYLALGALQERLASSEIEIVVLTACNAGRLFRPEIYHALNRRPRDRKFLPATRGFIDASQQFDSGRAEVRLARRADSRYETLVVGSYSELPTSIRTVIGERGEFAVSTLLVQLILRDSELELVTTGHTDQFGATDYSKQESELLFSRFLRYLRTAPTN